MQESGMEQPDFEFRVDALLEQQKQAWPLAKTNFLGLQQVQSRTISFEGFKIQLQFNPERIRSSAAKTDARSIQQRACFLCANSRPPEQRGLSFGNDYTVLINPFPIFEKHLTIPLNRHLPQEIATYFPDLLELSRQLPEYTVFYNGPKCGASAPDHFHFQAGNHQLMPINSEIEDVANRWGEVLFQDEKTRLVGVGGNYLRKLLYFRSASKEALQVQMNRIRGFLDERGQDGEPMMNLLANYRANQWELNLFPRDQQRPRQFFAEGGGQILMSPASVEMGGLVILPRKEDFEQLTADDLRDIYGQVSINDTDFEELKAKIKQRP
ncbi:DUF4922 domain-containing protein [Sunxiuqinia rutila]|uniref:DUF4922 domain-containing protein n=1 Tax=Sunxiuqinia rutila TaxID=1397841 RepID=UPI003D35F440